MEDPEKLQLEADALESEEAEFVGDAAEAESSVEVTDWPLMHVARQMRISQSGVIRQSLISELIL